MQALGLFVDHMWYDLVPVQKCHVKASTPSLSPFTTLKIFGDVARENVLEEPESRAESYMDPTCLCAGPQPKPNMTCALTCTYRLISLWLR